MRGKGSRWGVLAGLAGFLVAVAVGQTNPLLGAGGEGIRDWGRSNVYNDLIKQSRGFVVSTPTGDRAANVDANGWPTEPAFWTIVHTVSVGSASTYNGVYKLSFTGQGDVDPWWSIGGTVVNNKQYNASTNTTTYDVRLNYTNADSDGYLVLRFQNLTNGARNIRLLRPGVSTTNPPLFTTAFKNHAARFPVIRFMDWTETNFSEVVTWNDRTKPNAPSVATHTGVPWEHCIQLCNELDKDAWINIPAKADNNYLTQLAKLFKAQLEPGRKIYLEYSNEVWNFSFSQFGHNRDATIAELDAGNSILAFPGELGKKSNGEYENLWTFFYRRIAKRLLEIRAAFQAEYGAAAMNDTIRPVLAGQVVNPTTVEIGLDWMRRRGIYPGHYFYAIAGAPYFNLGSADQQTNLTADQVLNALNAGIDDWIVEYRDGYRALERQSALARINGLRFMSYEGGPDTFGPNNIAAKKSASLDPRMADLTERYLRGWYGLGGDLFMWFVMGATNYDTQYGTWGLTNDMSNQGAPKIVGVDRILNAAIPAPTVGLLVPAIIDARRHTGVSATWATDNPYLRWFGDGAKFDYLFRSAGTSFALRLAVAAPAGRTVLIHVNNNPEPTLVRLPASDEAFQWTSPIGLKTRAGLNAIRLEFPVGSGVKVASIQVMPQSDGFPVKPTNLTANPVESRRIQLAWDAVPGAGYYNIFRSTSPITAAGTPYRAGVRINRWLDDQATNGVRYYYRVTALGLNGQTELSNEVNAIATAPNLMNNPGFEAGNLSQWLAGGSTMDAVSTNVRTGGWAARINGSWNSLFQSFSNLRPGSTYTARGWFRSDKSSTRIFVRVRRTDGTEQFFSTAIPVSSSYSERTVAFTVPSNVDRVEVGLEDTTGASGFTWSDDWSLTEQ